MLIIVNFYSKDQSYKAFWLNKLRSFCWGLCNSLLLWKRCFYPLPVDLSEHPTQGGDLRTGVISQGQQNRIRQWQPYLPIPRCRVGGVAHGEQEHSPPDQQLENQVELQKNRESWQIFDANWSQQLPYMPAAHGGACYDEDFHKPASRMWALENGPFYADKFTTALLVCISGLESDENCHTFDADRNVIPGLYVAGNVQGNRFATEYPIGLKGVSHSMVMYYGYVAGKNAMQSI